MNNDILEKTLTPSDGQSGSDLSLIRSHIFTYVATTLPSSIRTLEVLTYNMVVKNQGAQYFNLGSLSLIVVKHNIACMEPSCLHGTRHMMHVLSLAHVQHCIDLLLSSMYRLAA